MHKFEDSFSNGDTEGEKNQAQSNPQKKTKIIFNIAGTSFWRHRNPISSHKTSVKKTPLEHFHRTCNESQFRYRLG